MKKLGYLSKKISKGHTYIYLRKSYRVDKEIKHKYLYSFGSMPDALEKMYEMRDNPQGFPKELIELGFDLIDLYDWILTIETKVTSTGRSFNV
ncbi:hypothetical protein [Cytobacillus kochii]|uniref:hypothetical protein n=1 Tax=Cytobacillus kochii TaxID=859143 RepID=UPI0025A2800D|nr:hypothetical protein [Cytobacillus kochii]MDM5205355.1 hypothetical protein [Cytobacillus kochii]